MRYLRIYLALFFTFLLGNHKGFVALWKDPAEEPYLVFPYSVASLPVRDQKMLDDGIAVTSEYELILLLEDYLS